MRAITVIPGQQGSVALTDMPEPPAEDGPIVVQTQAIGICGTNLEIINGEYGSAPPGQDRLVIGHESLGRVVEAAPGTGFGTGDLVVGIVRRRDPVPCPACAAGHWDMCMNGQYTERGIKGRHGYASECYRIHPEYLVAVDPALGILGVLLEPATVVAKAWDHIEKIGHRAAWAPEKVLVAGAGPIGLLAALLATQRGYQIYVLDRVTEGRKPEMVRRLGATYFPSGDLGEAAAEADIVIECTGHVEMLLEAGPQHVRYRITCLTGVSPPGIEGVKYKRNFRSVTGTIWRSLSCCGRDITELIHVSWCSVDNKSSGGHSCRLTPYPVCVKLCDYLGKCFITVRIEGRFSLSLKVTESCK